MSALVNICCGMNYQFARKLYNSVLANYTKHVKPRELSAETVNVYIKFHINSVIDFNEKSGVFTFLGKFTLKWWDEIIAWKPTEHGNLDFLQLSIHDAWVPKVVIGNTIGYHSLYKFDNYFDSKMIYVTYLYNGSATITSSGVWETICNVDISKFPFDEHECSVQLDSMHPAIDVKLVTNRDGAHINYTTMHSEFTIHESTVQTGPLHADVTWSQLRYQIKLARRPLFMMMNLVVPVYVISVANLLVFLLPLDSSDRMAYSVTMLLTFTVFMTMVEDKLPATDPLSNFNMFLILQLVFSTMITLCVLLIHLFYNKDAAKPAPRWLKCLTSYTCKKGSQVGPIEKDGHFESTAQWKVFATFLNRLIMIILAATILTELMFFYCLTGMK
ncbi:neuronal acetylcholine receptor subunit alpha-9-I-like [Mytilus edulis]